MLLVYLYCLDACYHHCATVFDPEYVWIKNLQGYDQITQYYFRPGDYVSEEDDGNGSGSDD